jgi:glycosyltransferase involved in cell wall biosynthesis
MTQRHVLVIAVHPATVAATRLRALQYEQHFIAEGLSLRMWSFFSAADLPRWFGASQLGRVQVVLRGLLRVPVALREIARADAVIVQREALPFGPPILEWLSARWRPLVWDVDDSVWVEYVSPTAGRIPRWLRAPADKYRRICGWASEVWPGSEVLAQWCRAHNDNVHVVPTVVPVPDSRPELPLDGTISWIGSHSTAEFLDDVLEALAEGGVRRRVVVVGGRPQLPAGLDVEVLPWSEQAEQRVLSATRVGLYPVDRTHPLAEGKCGLKAVLYMAHGIPPVITPTTTNAVVVRDGQEGFHAATSADWSDRVARLLDDQDLWLRMSVAAHQRARAQFSLETWGPRVAARLAALARDDGHQPAGRD